MKPKSPIPAWLAFTFLLFVCFVITRQNEGAKAANNVWLCPPSLQVLNGSSSLSGATFFTPTTAGWYDVKLAISPASSTLAATAGPTFNFTSDGVARSITFTSISLANLNTMAPPALTSLYLDAQPVTISMTATGTYNLRVCWRQSSY